MGFQVEVAMANVEILENQLTSRDTVENHCEMLLCGQV